MILNEIAISVQPDFVARLAGGDFVLTRSAVIKLQNQTCIIAGCGDSPVAVSISGGDAAEIA